MNFVSYQGYRIVGGAIDFGAEDAPNKLDRIVDNTMNLCRKKYAYNTYI